MSLKKLAGKISDAIPNEFSKLNSYAPWLNMIPGVGQALALTSEGIAGVDRFGETYSNGGSLGDSAAYGMSAFQGTSGDPSKYSSKNSGKEKDGFMTAGWIGDILPKPNGMVSSGRGGGADLAGAIGSIDFGSMMDGISMPSAYAAGSEMGLQRPQKINETSELIALANMIHGEAGIKGGDNFRIAAGSTALNRSDSNRPKEFGEGLIGVLNHPNAYYAVQNNVDAYREGVTQKFSHPDNEKAWKRSYQIAAGLKNGTIPRKQGLFYHNDKEIAGNKRKKSFDYSRVYKTEDIATEDGQTFRLFDYSKPNPNWGKRTDGTQKGNGYLGVLKRPDGGVSTEISVGVNLDGKEMDIPSLVPTLDQKEQAYLLNNKLSPSLWKTPIGQRIMQKAVDHAKSRIASGKSPYAD